MILNDNVAKKVQKAIVERSIIKDYPTCIVEWAKITEEDGGERGAYKCFCGSQLRYAHYYGNLHNSKLLCVGGVCSTHMDNTYEQIKHTIVLTPEQTNKLSSFRGGNIDEMVKKQLINIYSKRVRLNPTEFGLYKDLKLQVEQHHIEFLRVFLTQMEQNIYSKYEKLIQLNPCDSLEIQHLISQEQMLFLTPLNEIIKNNIVRNKIYSNILCNYEYDILDSDYPKNLLDEYVEAKDYFVSLEGIDDELKNETIEDDLKEAIMVHNDLIPILKGDCKKEKKNLKLLNEMLKEVTKDMFEKRVIWYKLKQVKKEEKRLEKEEEKRLQKEEKRLEKEEQEQKRIQMAYNDRIIFREIDQYTKILSVEELEEERVELDIISNWSQPAIAERAEEYGLYLRDEIVEQQKMLDNNYENTPKKYEVYDKCCKKIYQLETKLNQYRIVGHKYNNHLQTKTKNYFRDQIKDITEDLQHENKYMNELKNSEEFLINGNDVSFLSTEINKIKNKLNYNNSQNLKDELSMFIYALKQVNRNNEY